MPLSATSAQADVGRKDEPIVSWTVHLVRRQPERLPRLAVVMLGIFVLGLCVFHSIWLALLPVLTMVFALSEYLFPIRYTLTQDSISARHGFTALEMRWADVRHAYLTEEGIKLSPLRARNSRLESLRGIFLRFDAANKAEITDTVRRLRSKENDHR